MAIRHVNCHVPKRSTSSGQRTALYQFPGRSTSQENVSRTLSSFAGFSVSTSEVTSSWEAIRRGKSIHSCSFFSPLFRISFPRRKYRRCGGVKEHLRGKHIRSFTVFIDGERNSRSRRIDIVESIHIFLGSGRDAYKMVGCYLYTLAGRKQKIYLTAW